MAKRADTPVEERNYSHIYLLFSAALALTTFWAVWDMLKVRSPWQEVQREFNRLERSDLEQKHAAAKEKFDAESKARYEELQGQHHEAAAALQGEEYKSLLADSARAESEAAIARQNYRFAKSEGDAVYYEYKEAEYHGEEGKRDKLKTEVDEYDRKLVELKQQWDDAEARQVQAGKSLEARRTQVANLENEMNSMTAEMDNLRSTIDKIDQRKIKIQQVVMSDFVRGNFRALLNNVDRCQSCHIAATRKGLEAYPEPYKTHAGLDDLL